MPRPAAGVTPDEDQVFWRLFDDEPLPRGGAITPTGRPGLGVTLNESYLADHSVRSLDRHRS
jgi:L-alanine-DL-glutamate epimerase-like enolase superfamily enzyme